MGDHHHIAPATDRRAPVPQIPNFHLYRQTPNQEIPFIPEADCSERSDISIKKEIKRRRHIRRKKRSRSQSNQGNPLSKGQLARKERRFLSNPGTWKTLERKPEGIKRSIIPSGAEGSGSSGGASTGSKATSERSTKAEGFGYEAAAYFFKELVATEDEGFVLVPLVVLPRVQEGRELVRKATWKRSSFFQVVSRKLGFSKGTRLLAFGNSLFHIQSPSLTLLKQQPRFTLHFIDSLAFKSSLHLLIEFRPAPSQIPRYQDLKERGATRRKTSSPLWFGLNPSLRLPPNAALTDWTNLPTLVRVKVAKSTTSAAGGGDNYSLKAVFCINKSRHMGRD
ncbi:Hypothetical predicted protein [Olea europaea subsp. europaea]|uniref:Uncharacterized protein n=1 Tax=Olea europaea subsp. europaea TaxID=158383 RepID=A0A8S0VNI6_OLEEU|nr:Hypothetical predicted protein [Olea europaea subsp. europaea]